MEQRARAFWGRIKANRLAYTLTILLTLAVGILIGTVISYGVKGKENQGKASDASPLTLPAPKQLSNTFSQIAKQLEPSVVNINTESVIKNPHRRGGIRPAPGNPDNGGDEDNPFEDFFDRFFGGQGGPGGAGPHTLREHSLGSGVIVDPKGYIITNPTWSKRRIGFVSACRTIRLGSSMTPRLSAPTRKPILPFSRLTSTRLCLPPSWEILTACRSAIGSWPWAAPSA